MDSNGLKSAQAELQAQVARVLGPKTPGVSGIGAGLNASGTGLGLTVLVNNTSPAADLLQDALPQSIGGFPVRISRRGAGYLG